MTGMSHGSGGKPGGPGLRLSITPKLRLPSARAGIVKGITAGALMRGLRPKSIKIKF